MDNGKYLIWKLIFPRVADTFVTADKLLDMRDWEEVYTILQRITIQYAMSQLSSSLLSVQCCKNSYKLSIRKISMNVQCIHEFFNIDVKLLHDEVLCANFSLSSAHNDNIVENLAICEENCSSKDDVLQDVSSTNQISRKRPYAKLQLNKVSSLRKKEKMESSSSVQLIPTTSIKDEPVSDSEVHLVSDGEVYQSLKVEKSLKIGSVNDFKPDTKSALDTSASLSSTLNENSVKVPANMQQLYELMNDPDYSNRFCSKGIAPDDAENCFFNIYTIDNEVKYGAFHSAKVLSNIRDHKDCKLFFHYSEEMLGRLHHFTEVHFEGINHVLVIFVNHMIDKVTPFGFFLLPRKDKVVFDSVVRVIDGWLNGTEIPLTVTKCTTPQSVVLHHSIAEVWPNTKLMGCSAEYQNDIKLFAKENRVLGPNKKAELTSWACSLCFLPENNISTGIDVIQKRSSSEYGKNLVKYLRTKWIDRLISVYNEDLIQRSLKICVQYEKRMKRDYFRENGFGSCIKKFKNIWDFIEFLRSLSGMSSIEMCLDGTTLERSRRKAFEYNTCIQKAREDNIVNIRNMFNKDLKTMEEDEAIQQFMKQMALNI